MQDKILISHPNGIVNADVYLSPGKSESNRALLIKAVSGLDFPVHNLSDADDTVTLQELLALYQSALSESALQLNAGAAGTTFRFLTAFFSAKEGKEVFLTGSERLCQRPVKALVEALRELGADISYMDKEGFPPLRIKGKKLKGGSLRLDASVSSQFVSALMMISPLMEEPVTIEFSAKPVSISFIRMTATLMQHFGLMTEVDEMGVRVQKGNYQPKEYTVESDWSGASYWFEIMALASSGFVRLHGLHEHSVHPDSSIREIAGKLGVKASFLDGVWTLSPKKGRDLLSSYDFSLCPDIAQTVACLCAGIQQPFKLKGLSTLKIKETDRIFALEQELKKLGVVSRAGDDTLEILDFSQFTGVPEISTYEDHRMAMSFAPLSIRKKLMIQDPMVVTKSYPGFWKDLEKAGFLIEAV